LPHIFLNLIFRVDVSYLDIILNKDSLVTKNTIPFEIKESQTQDIDNEEDWKMAELKFKLFKKNNSINY